MKLKVLVLLFALMLASSTVSVAAPKKAEHCMIMLGEEDKMRCFRTLDELIVPQNHILMARLWDGAAHDGASFSIYNNDSIGSCGGGVPNLGAVGWDNRMSSFSNHCGILTFYYGNDYCCAMSPGYGQGWFSIANTQMNNQMSSLRW